MAVTQSLEGNKTKLGINWVIPNGIRAKLGVLPSHDNGNAVKMAEQQSKPLLGIIRMKRSHMLVM